MKPVLGVDLGEMRTGVALSDDLRVLAHPLETIVSASPKTVAQFMITVGGGAVTLKVTTSKLP